MKKILYASMALLVTFCFIGGVNAEYNEGTWEKVSCGKTISLDYADIALDIYDTAYTDYSFNNTTGIFINSGTKYSDLSNDDQNSGVFYSANDNTLLAYLIKVDNTTFEDYGITDAGENDYCIVTTTSVDNSVSYNITTYGETEHGNYQIKVNGSESDTAKYGEIVTIATEADEHYEATITILNESDEDITNDVNYDKQNGTFIMPANDVKISVEFTEIKYNILQEVTNGAITVPENASYGEVISLNPQPNEYYMIGEESIKILNESEEDITENVNYNSENYTFEMPEEPVKIIANFEKKSYNITKNNIENGSVIVKVGDEEVTKTKFGETVKLEIEPESYYEILPENIKILNESGEDVTQEVNFNTTNYTFEMPKYNIDIEVTFTKINYELTKPNIINGNISFPNTATYGELVTIQVNPNENYQLDSIYIYEVGETDYKNNNINNEVNYNEENHTFTMVGRPIKITAEFTTEGYNITKNIMYNNNISTTDIGSFEVKQNGMEISKAKYNSKVKIENIKPADDNLYRCDANDATCYQAIRIYNMQDQDITTSVDYNKTDGTFMMPGHDIKIIAKFYDYKTKIITETTAGGTISTSPSEVSGREVVLNINNNAGYILKNVEIKNALGRKLNIYNVSSHSFVMPTKVETAGKLYVKVTFAKLPSAPTLSANLVGYDDIEVKWNKVTGAEGYKVYWKKPGSSSYVYLTKKTATSVKLLNLVDGKQYSFKVVPYVKDINGIEKTGTAKYISIYTLKRLNTPTVVKYSKSYIKVKWNNISGETGYQISKSTKNAGTYIVKTVSSKYSATTIKATKNKKYYYKVRAYKTVNGKKIYGPWSYVKSYVLR